MLLKKPIESRPWYQHFWVWFIIALPLIAVIASISTVYVAFQNKPQILESTPAVHDTGSVNGTAQQQR